MIPVVTVAQMRAIDESAIGGNLTTGYSYMLKAGMGLFDAAREIVPDSAHGEIAVICGKGNNGGDGWVVARLLVDAGYRVMCFSLCDVDDLKNEAKLAFSEYAVRKGNYLVLDDASTLANLPHYALIIDAMLGTGSKGDPHGLCATAIEAINGSGVPVLAVDTPSGLNNDNGVPANPCVNASVTVTMGFPKIGLYFYPGKKHAGKLIVKDLGYPDEIVNVKKLSLFIPTPERLRQLLPPRKPAGSKFDHGLALLVCGSRGMTGSATLVAEAALRTGCGMTHLAAPESIVPILSCKLTETVIHPLPETDRGTPGEGAFPEIVDLAKSMQALCIGPGISHTEETGALVRRLIAVCPLPAILDADGINAYKGRAQELSMHAGDLCITPHRGEWERLFGNLPVEPVALVQAVREKAADYRCTILLKGNPTVVAGPDGSCWILPYGNSALAKAGSGDVLSGIIVSLIAQGASCTNAAILGAYIHGESGVVLSERMGEYSVLPSDIAGAIAEVMKELSAV
jgi:ADP-dependent NAD(P)H-hydrate dehydratase / NAD(P)H-hydrate epimerase